MAEERRVEPKFCYVCGEKLRMRYPGDDPENGPARMACVWKSHEPITDLTERAVAAGMMETFERTIEIVERHLDTCADVDEESAGVAGPDYIALRALRRDLVETILQMSEASYDNTPPDQPTGSEG
jgi:hypothetical protein